jgi:hypothetical protein
LFLKNLFDGQLEEKLSISGSSLGAIKGTFTN